MTSGQQGTGDGLYLRLEVLPGASHDEIARAYRRLAHDAHPDAHPGDPDAPARFRDITEAYEVLGNPDRRERYDRARRQAAVGTNRAAQAPAETPSRPGPAQAFAPPRRRPAARPYSSVLGQSLSHLPGSPLAPFRLGRAVSGHRVAYTRRGRSGLIGAAAVRHVSSQRGGADGLA